MRDRIPFLFIFLAGCTQVTEKYIAFNQNPYQDPNFETTCELMGQYSNAIACEVTSHSQCQSNSVFSFSGQPLTCFGPVAGGENCALQFSNGQLNWIYTPYTQPYENPLGSGQYFQSRSLIGCSNPICICSDPIVTLLSCGGNPNDCEIPTDPSPSPSPSVSPTVSPTPPDNLCGFVNLIGPNSLNLNQSANVTATQTATVPNLTGNLDVSIRFMNAGYLSDFTTIPNLGNLNTVILSLPNSGGSSSSIQVSNTRQWSGGTGLVSLMAQIRFINGLECPYGSSVGITLATPTPTPLPPPVLEDLAAGTDHTCALIKRGTDTEVKCWGANNLGQLGNNSPTNSNSVVPVTVSSLPMGVVEITAGWNHTCARLQSGVVYCWGDNSRGQIGNNQTTAFFRTANQVTSVLGFEAISAKGNHTCALTSGWAARCWGDNSAGQIGNDNSALSFRLPQQVTGVTGDTISIGAGEEHSCVGLSGGGMKCWGKNSNLQLGISPEQDAVYAPLVNGWTGTVLSIGLGNAHSCAITDSGNGLTGGARCWGYGDEGFLGAGSANASTAVPVNVSGLISNVRKIEAGSDHTCALIGSSSSNGAVRCWGIGSNGQLGNGLNSDSPSPVLVNLLSDGVSNLAVGKNHSCAIKNNQVLCWGGYNGFGEMGVASPMNITSPVTVPNFP